MYNRERPIPKHPGTPGKRKWICRVCGFLYDEAVGDAKHGLPAGTTIELAAIHKDFICRTSDPAAAPPVCTFQTPTLEGDCDEDGYVTLLDYRNAQSCLSGPAGEPLAPECSCVDLDADGDVDLFDLAYLQLAFSGAP